MLIFAKTDLYPTWKPHPNTKKDEIESPLQYSYKVDMLQKPR